MTPTPDLFADAVTDIRLEGGVFRLSLGVLDAAPGDAAPQMRARATLLLTGPGFESLCALADAMRARLDAMEGGEDAVAPSSPNFE